MYALDGANTYDVLEGNFIWTSVWSFFQIWNEKKYDPVYIKVKKS